MAIAERDLEGQVHGLLPHLSARNAAKTRQAGRCREALSDDVQLLANGNIKGLRQGTSAQRCG